MAISTTFYFQGSKRQEYNRSMCSMQTQNPHAVYLQELDIKSEETFRGELNAFNEHVLWWVKKAGRM